MNLSSLTAYYGPIVKEWHKVFGETYSESEGGRIRLLGTNSERVAHEGGIIEFPPSRRIILMRKGGMEIC